MRHLWLTSLLAVGASLVVGVEAQAQPLIASAESFECTIANADVVLIAKLIDFGGEQQIGDGEHLEGTIDVEETLKDDLFHEEPYRKLHVILPYPGPVLSDWKDRSLRLLVTLDERDNDGTRVIPLTRETLEILTADFRVLREPADVIRIAKETVRRFPAPVRRVHTFQLSVPREVVAGTRWKSWHSLMLAVPVDERLEKRAQLGILSESYSQREESARALRYFPSDDNTTRMQTLLTDPGWAYLHHASQNNGIEVRHYGVRQAAFGTLKSWGVYVEQPVIRE